MWVGGCGKEKLGMSIIDCNGSHNYNNLHGNLQLLNIMAPSYSDCLMVHCIMYSEKMHIKPNVFRHSFQLYHINTHLCFIARDNAHVSAY